MWDALHLSCLHRSRCGRRLRAAGFYVDGNIANASGTHCARDFDYESNVHRMRGRWLFCSYWEKPEAEGCYSHELAWIAEKSRSSKAIPANYTQAMFSRMTERCS
ncbi:hypothetical protein HN011_006810 [Eciton burchellii]|nr:hypothetical protein HN011_006810 [Eciton burchellii]